MIDGVIFFNANDKLPKDSLVRILFQDIFGTIMLRLDKGIYISENLPITICLDMKSMHKKYNFTIYTIDYFDGKYSAKSHNWSKYCEKYFIKYTLKMEKYYRNYYRKGLIPSCRKYPLYQLFENISIDEFPQFLDIGWRGFYFNAVLELVKTIWYYRLTIIFNDEIIFNRKYECPHEGIKSIMLAIENGKFADGSDVPAEFYIENPIKRIKSTEK
jgi:hypothetical protein